MIHRDLKPENVVVVDGQVKVLDFGLSVRRRDDAVEGEGCAGTLAYMAPELLQGAPASERSDLYAVGVIAHELFTGRLRSARVDANRTPVSDLDALDPALRPVVEHLLAPRPEDRYADAADVIAALATAVGQPIAVETVATRESFLRTAALVGRERELNVLLDALIEASRDRGATWIVSGESGVGKSRLLDELRTRALVHGVFLARGQSVSHGPRIFQLQPSDAAAARRAGAGRRVGAEGDRPRHRPPARKRRRRCAADRLAGRANAAAVRVGGVAAGTARSRARDPRGSTLGGQRECPHARLARAGGARAAGLHRRDRPRRGDARSPSCRP